MAKYLSKTAAGQVPVMSLNSALVAGLLYEFVTPATPLVAGDIIVMGPIEPGIKPVSVSLLTDDLDTNAAPTITLTVGILNAAGTDIDAAATSAWIVASTAGQTAGVTRSTSGNVYLAGASQVTRQLGIKVVAGPATYAGANKRMALHFYAAG